MLYFIGILEFYSMTHPTIRRQLFMHSDHSDRSDHKIAIGFSELELRLTVPFENLFLDVNSPAFERLEKY